MLIQPSAFLSFRSPSDSTSSLLLPASYSVLITDTLPSPGTFLLTYFISKYLRDQTGQAGNVVLIGGKGDMEAYAGILRKNVRPLFVLWEGLMR